MYFTLIYASTYLLQLNQSPEIAGAAKSTVVKSQSQLLELLKSLDVPHTVVKSITYLSNVVEVKMDDNLLPKIKNNQFLKRVIKSRSYRAPTPKHKYRNSTKPLINNAHDLTNVKKVWKDFRLTGKGIKVGIIDTGIDYTHSAFMNDRGVSCLGAGCRVEVGYDYSEDSDTNDPMDFHGHGTHVAGIVGGKNKEIVGVAPAATFGAYKIYGKDGSTHDLSILVALSQAYRDGMQIINLSIGYAPGWDHGIIQDAIEQLHKYNVIVVIANGNSGRDGLFMSEAPAIARNAIAVSAMNNIQYKTLSKFVVGSQVVLYDYVYEYNSFKSSSTSEISYQGSGCTPASVTPKSAILVDTNEDCDVAKQVAMAKKSKIEYLIVILKDQFLDEYDDIEFPIMYISNKDGQTLKYAIKQNRNVATMRFTKDVLELKLPGSGEPSTFTSLGLGSELQLKPEIGAPGHMIYSSLPKSLCDGSDCYDTWSGTSMATPYISGCAALYLEEFKDAEDFKTVLLNTAVPALKLENGLYSVAQQGAGMVDMYAMINAITSSEPPKLELLDKQDTMKLTITNHAKTFRTFSFDSVDALSIKYDNGQVIQQAFANKVEISPKSLQLESGKSGRIFIKIKPDPTMADSSHWIYSGYIKIISKDKVFDEISVPYAGFKGNYQSIPIFPPGYPQISHKGKIITSKSPSFTTAFVNDDIPVVVLRFVHPVEAIQIQLLRSKKALGLLFYDQHVPRHGTIYEEEDPSSFKFEYPLIEELGGNDFCIGCVSKDKALKYWEEIPDGEYYIKVDAQKPMGNVYNKEHYDSWISPKMIVKRGKSSGNNGYGLELLHKLHQ